MEPWDSLINAPEAELHTLSMQWLFRGRVCIPELLRSNVDGSVLFPSSCKLAWQ